MSTTALAVATSQAREYASQAKAVNTKRAYRSDWHGFVTWCEQNKAVSLPAQPAAVAAYLASRAREGIKYATLSRALTAISQAHIATNHASPRGSAEVKAVMQGIRRSHGARPDQKLPATVEVIKAMASSFNRDTITDARNRALILLGFAGAFRRSELASLRIEHVKFVKEGAEILLLESKTDSERKGVVKAILKGKRADTCPVEALKAWLDIVGGTEGPIFLQVNRYGQPVRSKGALSGYAISLIIKDAAARAGLDPAHFSGHSLRAGFVTSADASGASLTSIMSQTGHAAVKTVRSYIRHNSAFKLHAARKIGL